MFDQFCFVESFKSKIWLGLWMMKCAGFGKQLHFFNKVQLKCVCIALYNLFLFILTHLSTFLRSSNLQTSECLIFSQNVCKDRIKNIKNNTSSVF